MKHYTQFERNLLLLTTLSAMVLAATGSAIAQAPDAETQRYVTRFDNVFGISDNRNFKYVTIAIEDDLKAIENPGEKPIPNSPMAAFDIHARDGSLLESGFACSGYSRITIPWNASAITFRVNAVGLNFCAPFNTGNTHVAGVGTPFIWGSASVPTRGTLTLSYHK